MHNTAKLRIRAFDAGLFAIAILPLFGFVCGWFKYPFCGVQSESLMFPYFVLTLICGILSAEPFCPSTLSELGLLYIDC